jgi:alkanesulfonate monooxygenase SsuD/methylene tetrahydromethanopterin reductase-like flavin-dependent oxidoreductase (luciferase family)
MATTLTAARPVRFGLSLPNRAVLFGLAPDALIQAAEQAEASGAFDSIWVGDNLLSKPRLEAIVTLAALAARTTRVKLGVVCMASFPLRHPLVFALQWASLDVLSGGRTVLAVCLGGKRTWGGQFAAEMVAMGVEDHERIPRLEEGIQALRALWGPDEVTNFRGDYYALENVRFLPKPRQARVPIMLATNPQGGPKTEERALRRIARLADGWQIDVCPPDRFQRRWEQIREYAAEYGRADEVAESAVHLMVNINDDEQRAREESVDFLNHYYNARIMGPERLDTWLAIGSPAAVIDKVARYVEAGCTTPILRFTTTDQAGQIRRCVEEVLPAFASLTAASGAS